MLSEEKLRCAFKIFDRNRSGTITRDEIKENLGLKNDSSDGNIIDSIFSQANFNGDENISFREFQEFMKSL